MKKAAPTLFGAAAPGKPSALLDDPVLASLRSDSENERAEAVLQLCSWIGDDGDFEEALPLLLNALEDESWCVRMQALMSLVSPTPITPVWRDFAVRVKSTVLAPRLTPLIDDSELALRRMACQAFVRVRPTPDAEAALWRSLNAEDGGVRFFAYRSLEEHANALPPERKAACIARLARHRQGVIDSLVGMGEEGAYFLAELLRTAERFNPAVALEPIWDGLEGGNSKPRTEWTEQERVFDEVWWVDGSVGNGGFFGYAETRSRDEVATAVSALRTIGASAAADALETAMELFFRGAYPENPKEEELLYGRFDHEEIFRRLYAYAHAHASVFRDYCADLSHPPSQL